MAATLVSDSRFGVLKVTKKVSIREFVRLKGLDFHKGKGYYQLTKPETIQDYKEVVVYRKRDGVFVSGEKVREILGIPKNVRKYELNTSKLSDFKMFVQSTSYNRNLVANTDFLYEVVSAGGTKRKADDSTVLPPSLKRVRSVSTLGNALPPPPPHYSAGGPIEIAFSFDTTGSMSHCLNEVRNNLQELIQRLYSDIPTLRMAVFAHGDYCDRKDKYLTQYIDFTTDVDALCKFVNDVKSTWGGDFEEAYEVVLREVQEKLSWTPGTQRALVMIGDACPHEPDYSENMLKIDWKEETDRLIREKFVRAYAVQCGDDPRATKFFTHLATQTHGHLLKLQGFKNIQDFIMAICYAEQGPVFLQAYHTEVSARYNGSGMNAELHKLFDSLGGSTVAPKSMTPPVSPSPASPKTPTKKRVGKTTASKRSKTVVKNLFTKKRTKKAIPMKPKKATRRTCRETIPSTKFIPFKRLHWSSWEPAVVTSKQTYIDKQCEAVGKGFVNFDLFKKNFKYPAIYEFSVLPSCAVKKSVVYLRTSRGFANPRQWYRRLLGQKRQRSQIDGVIKSGCDIFVRRCCLTANKDKRSTTERLLTLRREICKRYDYSWNLGYYGRKTCRLVKAQREKTASLITISNDMF